MTPKELKALVGNDTYTIAFLLWNRGQTYLAMHVLDMHAKAHTLTIAQHTVIMTRVNADTFKV